FRQQMLSAQVERIDAVLYTHPHADHVHGIDDLRGFALSQREQIPVYADYQTQDRLIEGFNYCFAGGQFNMYPPILQMNTLATNVATSVSGEGGAIHILPVLQTHGPIHSLGFRFSMDENLQSGGLCYSSDVSAIPQESLPLLQALDVWILDALQYKPHISHFSVSEALEITQKLLPTRAILTHLHIPLDYETLRSELPGNIEPAFDGMVIEL
ncbi:MAG: MBL fold metallo-hydrolase, partial [Pseudomonadota bacterium]